MASNPSKAKKLNARIRWKRVSFPTNPRSARPTRRTAARANPLRAVTDETSSRYGKNRETRTTPTAESNNTEPMVTNNLRAGSTLALSQIQAAASAASKGSANIVGTRNLIGYRTNPNAGKTLFSRG